MERSELLAETVSAYTKTARLMKAIMQDGSFGDGIGSSQLHLMFAIATWTPAPTQKQLAESMHITPGALTQLIEPLVEAGYVTRQPSQTDRRVMHLHLSANGKKSLRKLREAHAKLFTDLLDSLTDQELVVLLQAQQKMLQTLESNYKKKGTA